MSRDFNTEVLKPQMNTDRHRSLVGFSSRSWRALREIKVFSHKDRKVRKEGYPFVVRRISNLSVFICVYLWLILLSSCSSKPTNLRALAPTDTLVYLETNDLAAALQPIVDNKAFTDVAKSKPDFSALRGIQLAVVVTGFETREEKVTDENSIGRIQPHFAAIADTHAWTWQAKSFAENQLGEFINNVYGGGVNLDTAPKNGGTYYTWTAEDGRKAYAFVDGSLIFFGNDESSIDKCLAVKNGQADSILKNPKLPQADPNALAQGYISTDGVAQIANIAGLAMAAGTGEEEQVKSFIAGALPQILRSSVSDVSWTMTKGEQGIEDKYLISMPPEISNVLSEAMRPSGDLNSQRESNEQTLAQLPETVDGATRYNFKDPELAWRGIMSVAANHLEGGSGKLVAVMAEAILEQYGIHDADTFLRSVGNDTDKSRNIFTAKFGDGSEGTFVLAMSGDTALTRKSFVAEMKPAWQGEDGFFGLKTTDGDLSARFSEGILVLGPSDQFGRLTNAYHGKPNDFVGTLLKSSAPIITVGRDIDTASQAAASMSGKKSADAKADSNYLTETRFTKDGVERKTTSDFGLIGSIVAQLAPEE